MVYKGNIKMFQVYPAPSSRVTDEHLIKMVTDEDVFPSFETKIRKN